ncbi:MAG: hypothetical protein GQ574_14430 [Crocinitomix sp.]|nr:hypothetical protein [Crocinitomix sp.]
MKIIFVTALAVSILSFVNVSSTQTERYDEAEIYCQSIQVDFEKIAITYELDYKEVLPIVFPECTRFSQFSDQMETTALEYFYVKYGSEGANFSIGRFQMKPSFIEQLEKEIPSLELSEVQKKRFDFESSEDKKIRSERVSRLTETTWQIHYLCLFYKVMDKRMEHRVWQSRAARVAYYAAAYNYGFLSSETEIEAWQLQSKFPTDEYGGKAPYSQIASDYYLKIAGYEN